MKFYKYATALLVSLTLMGGATAHANEKVTIGNTNFSEITNSDVSVSVSNKLEFVASDGVAKSDEEIKKEADTAKKKSASNSNSTSSKNTDGSNSSSSPRVKVDGFVMPFVGNPPVTLTSDFGPRSFDGLHYGIDLVTGSSTTQIAAVADGTVVFSGLDNYGGETIIIEHEDGVYTLYGHMASGTRLVDVGDKVQQGDAIGTIGTTGLSTGIHLHFEVATDFNGWVSGQVDPKAYLPVDL